MASYVVLMRSLAVIVSTVALAVACAPRAAHACGTSGPGGIGVEGCSLEEHDEQTRPRWRVGAGYAFTSTTIVFSGGSRADERRHAAVATLDLRPTSRVTLQLGLGALLGGGLDLGSSRYDFGPGFAAVVGASWRVLDAEGARPFVLLGAQLAFSASTTRERGATDAAAIGYEALDLRVGVAAGYTIAHALSVYALARAFGGPVFWRIAGDGVTGTDLYHFQVGAGVSATVAKRLDFYVEGVPLGELGVTAGLGWSF